MSTVSRILGVAALILGVLAMTAGADDRAAAMFALACYNLISAQDRESRDRR